jgi:hypothetical protein
MKVIIAGSRNLVDIKDVEDAIKTSGFEITEVVSGAAKGVDHNGEVWAKKNGIRVKQFHANWNKHGRTAGYVRNQEMADYAEGLIAVWDGESNGTRDMIRRARKLGLVVHVYTPEKKRVVYDKTGPFMIRRRLS